MSFMCMRMILVTPRGRPANSTWIMMVSTSHEQHKLSGGICSENISKSGSFQKNCLTSAVSDLLLAMVSVFLESPSIQYQSVRSHRSAALTVAHLLKINSVKYARNKKATTVWNSINQKTPLPLHIGLMLHANTRKKELVDKLGHLGRSSSYDRVRGNRQ